MYLRDATGGRLKRAGADGLIDHIPAEDADLFIQVHDTAFAGGQEHFFRLEITTGSHIDFVYPPVLSDLKESAVTLYGRNLPNSVPSSKRERTASRLKNWLFVLWIWLGPRCRVVSFCLPHQSFWTEAFTAWHPDRR